MTSDPKIGVICPAYGYPGFLPEMTRSLLEQKSQVPFRAVLIDDCCPDPETVELCTEYATAYPDLFQYIRPSKNRGLSGVRNMGVDFLLSHYPKIEGLTFVDADDRLFPLFIERCYEALQEAISLHDQADTKAGWVFEDPYMIGIPGLMRRLRKHSLLWNMVGATQTSSSIFSADLFRSGLRYAEDMKHGGEDWEFSLRAYKAGFRAYFKPSLGLRYRRRPGSMSSGVAATIGMERNRVDIRLKHPDLYKIGPVTAQYEKECPHYCIITETGDIRVTPSIEEKGGAVSLSALAQNLSDNASIPGVPVPQLYIFANSAFLETLKKTRRLFDFAARANAHAYGKKMLAHTIPENSTMPELVHERTVPYVDNRDTSVGALSMSLEAFVSFVNRKDWREILDRQHALPWRFQPGAKTIIHRNAFDIFEKTRGIVKSIMPTGIRPAHRYNEQMWRPAGMDWRDLPSRLSGISCTFPEPRNRQKLLVLTDGENLHDDDCRNELLTFSRQLLRATPSHNLALGIFGSSPLDSEMTDLFSAVYFLPDPVQQGHSSFWTDDRLLVSISSSFGRIVSLGTTRISTHSPILLSNGVELYHKLYKRSKDFKHGRLLISIFKAYKGFVYDEEADQEWLISHGVPIELTLQKKCFCSILENRADNSRAGI